MRRNLIKRVMAGFGVAAVLAANCMTSFAATTTFLPAASVDLNSRNDFKINAGQYGDLFSNMKNMVPGGSASNTVSIRNNSSESVTFYLKADSNFTAAGENAVKDGKVVSEPGKKFKDDFLDKVDMIITIDGTEVYHGKASGEGDLVTGNYGIKLSTVQAHSSVNLVVSITLSGPDIGNEYSGVFGAVDWMFMAEGTDSHDSGGSDDSGGSGGDPGGGPDIVVVETVDVPLADLAPGSGLDTSGDVGILIEDQGVPLAGLAKTGGPVSHLAEISGVVIILAAGLYLIDRKRKKTE